MAKSQEQIITDQAKDITRLKHAVTQLEHRLRETAREAARAKEGVRSLRNDVNNVMNVLRSRTG